MKLDEIRRIAVIGAGMMGSQLAELFARAGGYEVYMVDLDEALVGKGIKAIDDRLERFFVSKGKMSAEQKANLLARIKGTTDLEGAVKNVNLAIEAVKEQMAIKKELFKRLDKSASQEAILATNTSYLNITEIASGTGKPDRILGMHFFNPVSTMRLVEVVRSARTSDETIRVAFELLQKMGKEPVICRDSSFGFLANRAYRAFVQEAVQIVWERVAKPEDVDKALKLGYNLPMGPLELMDFVGGWTILADTEQDAMKEFGPDKGHLHPLVRMMVRAGYNNIYKFWNDVLK